MKTQVGDVAVSREHGLEVATFPNGEAFTTVCMRGDRILHRSTAYSAEEALGQHQAALDKYRDLLLPEERYLALALRSLLDAGLLVHNSSRYICATDGLDNLWERAKVTLENQPIPVNLEAIDDGGVDSTEIE